MKVTVVLRDDESWRIPIKLNEATVQWLIEELASRRKRRLSSRNSPLRDVPMDDITGMRKQNSAILEPDDVIMEHCIDGDILTAIYATESEVVEQFTDLVRHVNNETGSSDSLGSSESKRRNALATTSTASNASNGSDTVVAATSASRVAKPKRQRRPVLQRRYESKLRDGFDRSDESETLSTSDGHRFTSPPNYSTLRSDTHSMLLSVVASTDGDRVDVHVDERLTAKDVIAEVVMSLYGKLSERREYGLATLDGVLLGPAMPIVDLFGASRVRARVVLVYPPDDDSTEPLEESLGVAIDNVSHVAVSRNEALDSHDSATLQKKGGSFLQMDDMRKVESNNSEPELRTSSSSVDAQSHAAAAAAEESSSATEILFQRTFAKLDSVEASQMALAASLQAKRRGASRKNSAGHAQAARQPLLPLPEKRRSSLDLGELSLNSNAKVRERDKLLAKVEAMTNKIAALHGSSSKTPPSPSPPPRRRHGSIDKRDASLLLANSEISVNEVEICEFLGKGGSTRVYRAVARGITLAAKVFDMTFADEHERAAVSREIELMQSFDSPYIVRYLGAHQIDANVYLFMPFYMGTLRDDINQRRQRSSVYHVSRIASYSSQIARGLKYLHSRSCIHRDMKSENVFVEACVDGSARMLIGDFGESTVLEKSLFGSRLKRSVCNVGTTEFRAPELWSNSKSYDFKVDVWAFGMLLFELLTLDIPYRRENLKRFDIPAHIAQGHRPQLPPDTHSSLSPVIKLFLRCSDADPSTRPTAKELVHSLAKINRIFDMPRASSR